MPSVADFIEKHRAQLVQRYAEEAGKLESARGLSLYELTNTFPEYLDTLAAISRQGHRGDPAKTKRRLDETHLSLRLRLGYNQEEVTSEYAIMGRLIAALWAGLPREQQPPPEDTTLLFAELQAAMDGAIEFFSGYSMEDRQREKRTLRRLDTLAPKLLERSRGPVLMREQLKPLVELIQDAMKAQGAELYLAAEDGQGLVMVAASGACSSQPAGLVLAPDPASFLGKLSVSEEPLHLPDVSTATQATTEGLHATGLRSLLGLRLWPHGELLGVLYVGLSEVRSFEPQSLRYFETLVEYLSGIIDRGLLFGKLHEKNTQLSESAERWRLFVQGIQDYATIYMLDAEGRVISWNPGAERFEGYRAEEVLGKKVELFYPEDARERGEPEADLREAAARGRHSVEGWRVRNKDPSPFWAEMTLIPHRDVQGHLRGFTKVTRDLTERHRVEQERTWLLERERHRAEQLRGLAEATVALAASSSLDAVLTLVTEQARQLIGTHQAFTSMNVGTDHGGLLTTSSLSEKYAAWREAVRKTGGSVFFASGVEGNLPVRMTQAELVAHPLGKAFVQGREERPPMRGCLAVPLTGPNGKSLGLLQLSDKEEGDFTEEDEAILVQLARVASVAVENLRLYTALRESEDRLRMALQGAQLGTYDLKPVTGELRWDERTKALFGLPPDAEVTYDTFLAGLHPEDRAHAEAAVQHALEPQGGMLDFEFRAVGAQDRTVRWVRSMGRALYEGGRAVRLTGIVQDVSSLKQAQEALARSEREFRTLAESMPQIVWTARPDGQVDYANQRLSELTGKPPEEFLQSGWHGILQPDNLSTVAAAWERALSTGELYQVEQHIRRKDGVYRWHLTRGVPVRDAHGQVIRWVGTSTDIDDIKRTEAELRQRATFEQQIVGIVSHDLRNPLNAITLSAQALLRGEELTERQAKSVARLISAAERATRLTRDLLDFTQARLGGGIPIERKPLDFHAAVRLMLEEVQAAHPERVIDFRCAGEGRGTWDGDRLAQVVTNLVNNALTYSPQGTPVRVETRGEGRAVLLRVHNEGAPIPADVLPQLFEPMRRGTEQGSAGRSIGLGLFIVDNIIRAHGGRVEVNSAEGAGTTFTVHLPRS